MTLRNALFSSSVALCVMFVTVFTVSAQSTTTSATSTSTSTSDTAAPAGTALGVTLNATPRISAGTPDGLLALVIMQAGTGSAVQVSSVPISMTFGGGLSASHLTDCRARNVLNLGVPLNTTVPSVGSGLNTFTLASPVTVGAGSTVTLAITCDVSAAAPTGGTLALGMTPSTLQASAVGSGTAVTPSTGQDLNGNTGPLSGTTIITAAGTTPIPTVPGVPNTGGNSPLTVALLMISGAFSLGAIAFLARRRIA